MAAGLKTKSNKIGYVAAMDVTNSEVTGGINAFAMGVESVNPNAKSLCYSYKFVVQPRP
ncbi:MAG: hypothetical protein L6V93_11220 [Clostridiales bacterium]|nr:MAG: hypothetical protein L6V93_11220 [Clostridiales bacterium]